MKAHYYRVGVQQDGCDTLPDEQSDPSNFDVFVATSRRHIEPWLSALFQSEHLNLLLGSGFTAGVSTIAGSKATGMDRVTFGTDLDKLIDLYAARTSKEAGRGNPNSEDRFRSAMALADGLSILGDARVDALRTAMNRELTAFLSSLLKTERGISDKAHEDADPAQTALSAFLLSFAGRPASRERLHLFTTNYDRLVEYGCDQAGLRAIDRFVGALNPVFRSSRLEVDLHYNPPGIRGEPRFMEGVIRLTKLHGSLDWHFDRATRQIARRGVPFGAASDHSDMPKNPLDTVMIYPNPAKDIETLQYPYADLFRDFAAAICRPNTVLMTYGYGLGDDHINRVIRDMLTIPSTHLVIFAYARDPRLERFLEQINPAQVTLLVGPHYADLGVLVRHYLPRPGLDYINERRAVILRSRPRDAAAATMPTTPNPEGEL